VFGIEVGKSQDVLSFLVQLLIYDINPFTFYVSFSEVEDLEA